ncbi:MAG: hypothetical protein KIT22_02425, partial [Verrucomicrobiae bacterium]|nr:hypothetical protein [Verrucomicrobiae bacterium]
FSVQKQPAGIDSAGADGSLAGKSPFSQDKFMFKTIPGTFKAGTVQLAESAAGLPEGPVLVTFLEPSAAPSHAPSLTPEQMAGLRGKLAAWEEDWNAPGMEAYDRP